MLQINPGSYSMKCVSVCVGGGWGHVFCTGECDCIWGKPTWLSKTPFQGIQNYKLIFNFQVERQIFDMTASRAHTIWIQPFLVSGTQVYRWPCPSIYWSVPRSITLELKMRKTRIYDTAELIRLQSNCMCLWVCDCVAEVVGHETGDWMPLPTRPQQYWDPGHLFIRCHTMLQRNKKDLYDLLL